MTGLSIELWTKRKEQDIVGNEEEKKKRTKMILIMFYKYACHKEIVTGFSGYR